MYSLPKRINMLICLVPVAAGILIILYSTQQGIGISPDSVTYISVARNIINHGSLSYFSGDGSLVPMTEYPPLYPLFLAVPGLLGVDPVIGARLAHAILFALNVALFAYIIYNSTKSFFFSILGALILLGSKTVILIHSMACSEPIFLFFALLGLHLLSKYLANKHFIFLITSSLVISMAILSRYAGLPLVVTGVTAILILSSDDFKNRVKASAIFAFLCLLPLMIWMNRNFDIAGSLTNRDIHLVFHFISWKKLLHAAYNFSVWFIPYDIPLPKIHTIIVIFLFSLLLFCTYYWLKMLLRSDKRGDHTTPLICISFIVFYLIFLVTSISLYAADTPLDERILSPVLVVFIWMVLLTGHSLIISRDQHKVRLVLMAVFAVWATFNFSNGLSYVKLYHQNGLEYTSKQWKEAAIMREAMRRPRGEPIYSNHPGAIYAITGRLSSAIPSIYNVHTLSENASLIEELTIMKRHMEQKDAVLVWFDLFHWPSQPTIKQLKSYLPLHVVVIAGDGAIYAIKKD